MRITKTQLRHIIKEEIGKVLNEEETLFGVFKRLYPVPKHVKRSMQGEKKVYDMNNGNILVIDGGGVPYVSYADERAEHIPVTYLFDKLDADGYRRGSLAVPMSPANVERLTLGGPIDAEEIMSYESKRRDVFDEEAHLPLIRKAVGRREISDPGQPNWDSQKDQIVYLGAQDMGNRGEVIFFKTSQTGKYYKIHSPNTRSRYGLGPEAALASGAPKGVNRKTLRDRR